MSSRMIMLQIPQDSELLAAFGEVTLRHEHLNHVLRMTVKTLANLRPEEALDATAYDGSARLREIVRKLARKRLGDSEALLKLKAILKRCERATDKRNDWVHGIWAQELDGEAVRRSDDHSWHPLPTTQELRELAEHFRELTAELNEARLEGFLHQALAHRVPVS